MSKKVKGCVHLIVKHGEIESVYTHLSDLPKEGVVHLKGDKIYTNNEFKKSHPYDHIELEPTAKKIIISDY